MYIFHWSIIADGKARIACVRHASCVGIWLMVTETKAALIALLRNM